MMSHSRLPATRSPAVSVELSDTQAHLAIDPAWVERIVGAVLDLERIDQAMLSVVFTDNASIRVINARYLEHDWPTDVISWPDSTPDDPELAGELIISTEMAVETARLGEYDPLAEVALYLVHGLLHLRGYDDQTEADAALIRRREAEVLAVLEIDNPFDRVDLFPAWSEDSVQESVRWPR